MIPFDKAMETVGQFLTLPKEVSADLINGLRHPDRKLESRAKIRGDACKNRVEENQATPP